MTNPLDWRIRLLHQRNIEAQYEMYAARIHRVADPSRLAEWETRPETALNLLATADVWDLPDPVLAEQILRLAEQVPFTDRIAAESVPTPYGVLRLPESGWTIYPDSVENGIVARIEGILWGPSIWNVNDPNDPGEKWTTYLNAYYIVTSWPEDRPEDRLSVIEQIGLWPVDARFADAAGLIAIADGKSFTDGSAERIIGVDEARELWVSASIAVRYLLAVWALAASEALTTTAIRDRHASKRSRRAGFGNDRVVRVTLPAGRSGGGAGTGDGAGMAAHWVRGHWRWQPVGEGRQDRRLTWVRPHVRGTVGEAPDAPGPKITTIRRTG